MSLTPFHVALQVRDIPEARRFYGDALGLPEGRSSDAWVDFNLFGHQFVVHHNPAIGRDGQVSSIANAVDGHGVPVPHCGVVLTIDAWDALRLRVEAVVDEFVIAPYTRFAGEPGEQRTMFFTDPSGNALEFKAFANIEAELFRR
ncbi:MAG: VOC family protein [Pseudomonadaceae bacterium]|nr:VOC family protein [Pseudomonadaceae bacterium]